MLSGSVHYGTLQSDTNSYPDVRNTFIYHKVMHITNEVTKITCSLFLFAKLAELIV